ncbi:hypothetical protein MMC26_003237 [Xylographa opegraphella]|nr:hypothetical protein [Xylographa opegraphella]
MPSLPFPLPTPSTLTAATLSPLLTLYAPTLAHLATTKRKPKTPSTTPDLPALDLLRYTTIPARVRARRTAANSSQPTQPTAHDAPSPPPPGPHGWLEKDELELVVAWKLTRGHARPSLPALIRSNAAELVRSTTAHAYALFAAADGVDPFPALKALAQLRGVGPATASLLLAVAWPADVPFFADELLGWLRGGEGERLRYDWKEYGEVWEGVRAVGLGAEEVERGAWVMGMVGRGMGPGEGGGAVRGEDGKDLDGEAVVAPGVGPVEEMEEGGRKRKARGDAGGAGRSAKVPRRRKAATVKEEKAADISVPRRSTRNIE